MTEASTPAIIAIDGPAASGKGTLAKRLADELGFAYLDTGKLYRYVGLSMLDNDDDPGDAEQATAMAMRMKDHLRPEDLEDPRIGRHDAGNAASQVAQFTGVRQALYDYQVDFANNPPDAARGAVIDGRDIGTVIAPDADVKLYITASPDIRASRRFQQLQSEGGDVSYDDILQDMLARDKRDAVRQSAPMQQAEGAHVIDTSEMDIEAAYRAVTRIVHMSKFR